MANRWRFDLDDLPFAPDFIMANLTQQQLQDLIAAVTPAGAAGIGGAGGRRLPAFSTGTAEDWLSWKQTYQNHVTLHGWNDAQQMAQLKAAMEGTAARTIAHLGPNDPATNAAWQPAALLAAYSNCFLPPAQSKLALVQFEHAKQGDRESLQAWHTRCRELYSRAYPAGDPETAAELRYRFTVGIGHPHVRERVYEADPGTYSEAFTIATARAAGVLVMQQAAKDSGQRNAGIATIRITESGSLLPPMDATAEPRVGAVGGGGGRGRGQGRRPGGERERNPVGPDGQFMKCHVCQSTYHFQRECTQKPNDGTDGGAFGAGRGGGNQGRGRGGRGRGRGGGRGGSRGQGYRGGAAVHNVGGAEGGAADRDDENRDTAKSQLSQSDMKRLASLFDRLNAGDDESEN